MSTLLFWQGRGKGAPGGANGRNWIHAPDVLVKGHVAYLVKFLGSTQVDQPKGIEVVKDAIRRLQFNQQLKKSEAKENAKSKKVEITISVDGVAVQEPRTSNILHQFPLHRISYCADDKGAKKYFSFIAKGQPNGVNGHDGSNGTGSEQHECFVFVSTKLASEITLTIGQAFDLAYRRFLNDNGKYIELQKLTLQNKKLELQNQAYKTRLIELSKVTYKDDLDNYLAKNNLVDITEWKPPQELMQQLSNLSVSNGLNNGTKTPDLGIDVSSSNSADSTYNNSNNSNLLLATPPPNKHMELMGDLPISKNPVVGTKLEGLLLNSDSDSDFDPRASETEVPARSAPPPSFPPPVHPHALSAPAHPAPLLAPPPKTSKRNLPAPSNTSQLNGLSDAFGSTPFTPSVPTAMVSPMNQTSNQPNYDISDFNMTTSVFNSSTNSFTNGLYDPFETQKGSNLFNGNGYNGNGYNNANIFNGFAGLSEKQTVALDSNFNGFLDKTISEMKNGDLDGFSRGITFGNDDFSLDNLDPLKKN